MHRTRHFIEPLDVLFLRGNKLFGDPGSFSDSLMPPRPSVVAGALRSALLAHKDIDLVCFGRGAVENDELGTPERPGPFAVTAFHLARKQGAQVEPLFQLPADLIVKKDIGDGQSKGKNKVPAVQALRPARLSGAVLSSQATSAVPVLAERQRGKPDQGWWLTAEGWSRHLNGETVDAPRYWLREESLWGTETRVGVGLDAIRRRAADGQLFSVGAVSLHKAGQAGQAHDIGFLAETVGACFPSSLALRFGGDGRCALSRQVDADIPEIDSEAIARERRCRLILTTPGVFTRGWLPTGAQVEGGADLGFNLHGVKARITCTIVPRAETVSGFDLAKRMPKPAHRAAAVGSVYWLEDVEATPEALRNLAARGLWSDPVENPPRYTEGFNRFAFGLYPKE